MPKKPLAQVFKEARIEAKLTQAELALKAGLAPNSYAKIERGITKPEASSIQKLAKALSLKIDIKDIQ